MGAQEESEGRQKGENGKYLLMKLSKTTKVSVIGSPFKIHVHTSPGGVG